MKIHTFTLDQSITWEQLFALGINAKFYNLELWLMQNGIDDLVLPKLAHNQKLGSKFTLWRMSFLRNINNWSLRHTADEVTERLPLRCFTRLQNLNERTPSFNNLETFELKNKSTLNECFSLLAGLWANDHRTNKHGEWAEMMDRWAEAVMTP